LMYSDAIRLFVLLDVGRLREDRRALVREDCANGKRSNGRTEPPSDYRYTSKHLAGPSAKLTALTAEVCLPARPPGRAKSRKSAHSAGGHVPRQPHACRRPGNFPGNSKGVVAALCSVSEARASSVQVTPAHLPASARRLPSAAATRRNTCGAAARRPRRIPNHIRGACRPSGLCSLLGECE
jgi:hypothetical protein